VTSEDRGQKTTQFSPDSLGVFAFGDLSHQVISLIALKSLFYEETQTIPSGEATWKGPETI
jgi:hypothetical protein